MLEVADEWPLRVNDFLLLLNHLISGSPELLELDSLRSAAPPLTRAQAWDRVRLLSGYLEIPESQLQSVAEGFAHHLSKGESSGAKLFDLLAAVVQSSLPRHWERSDVLSRYEGKVTSMLSRSATGMLHEAVGDFVPTDRGQVYKPRFDLSPLTRKWPRTLLESPSWSRIESPVPGVPDLPMESSWVNLTLRRLDAGSTPRLADMQAIQALGFDRSGVGDSVKEVLLQLKGVTVITGLPGAGKSTLVKWIARHIITAPECPFGIPIVISLRQYARERAEQPGLSLLEYFFKSRGIIDQDQLVQWRMIASGLLDPPSDRPETVETFLWLLDGWDEVPAGMRDGLLPEIGNLTSYPVIITTRFSGDPQRLPAVRRYEVMGLKHSASLELANRWLKLTSRELYYGAIEEALEHIPELRRMARSPFLLTLICALGSNPEGGPPRALPRNRGDVIREALQLIYEQHNHDTKQPEQFKKGDKEDVSRLSCWLLASAPDAPRYVFDGLDYDDCTGTKGRFESLLVPSRLIARPSVETSDYQFLHANFQEYLAAEYFSKSPDAIPKDGSLILHQQWKEVARFLAARVKTGTPEWEALWYEVKKVAINFDRFGILASRLASMLAAAKEEDGGQRILGFDLRDQLWKILLEHPLLVPTPPLEAFLELDPTGLARRILDHRLKRGGNSTHVSWLELIPPIALEPLFDDAKYLDVLALPEVSVFCQDLPNWVLDRRKGASRNSRRIINYGAAIAKAVKRRDLPGAKTAFWTAVRKGHVRETSECVSLFGEFDSELSGPLLLEIAVSAAVDDLTRGAAVSELIRSGSVDSQQRLIAFLASQAMDDPCTFAIIGNLSGYQLSEMEARLVTDFLHRCPDADTRSYAAELLSNTRSRQAAESLMDALAKEKNKGVRISILRMLAELADDAGLERLWAIPEPDLRTPEELGLWLRAVLVTYHQRRIRQRAFGEKRTIDPLNAEIRARTRLYLQRVTGKKRRYAAIPEVLFEFPEILGSDAISQLKSASVSNELTGPARVAAVGGLAKMRGLDAVTFLKDIAIGKTPVTGNHDFTVAVCEALGQLSPVELSKVKSVEAEQEMARLAFRHQILFFKNDVQDANGRSLKLTSIKTRLPTASMHNMPIKADIAVFIALQEEFDTFRALIGRRGGATWVHKDDEQKAVTFYGTKIELPGNAGSTSIVAMCPEEMGPGRAAGTGSILVDRFTPAILAVIGIAGSLTDDLLLGDVLVPNEVYAIFENSAATDLGQKWELKLSGKHYQSDAHLLNQVRQFHRKYPNILKQWQQRARHRSLKSLGPTLSGKAHADSITRTTPLVVAGDNNLASGPAVGKSEAFAQWVKGQNRKAHALEMETAAAFDAAWTTIHPPRLLAIRGISDFADKRKERVEKDYEGKFRTISMQNAADYFLMLVQSGVLGGKMPQA